MKTINFRLKKYREQIRILSYLSPKPKEDISMPPCTLFKLNPSTQQSKQLQPIHRTLIKSYLPSLIFCSFEMYNGSTTNKSD